jgi:hypothetical protein
MGLESLLFPMEIVLRESSKMGFQMAMESGSMDLVDSKGFLKMDKLKV